RPRREGAWRPVVEGEAMNGTSRTGRGALAARTSRRATLRTSLLLGAGATSGAVLAACGGSSSSSSSSSSASNATTAAGQGTAAAAEQTVKGGTLRMGLSRFPETLDPHLGADFRTQRFTEQLYAGLIKFSPKLEFQPDLAAAYEWADDTTLKVTLRDGL